MHTRGSLSFTIGLPRSGKSTFAAQWARTAEATITLDPRLDGVGCDFSVEVKDVTVARPRVVVCGDDFRTALHGRTYIPEAEGTVFAMMDVAVRALLAGGFDVLIDETCTTEATLGRYLKIDPDALPVWVDTPEEECVRRAREAGKEYLVKPIGRMAEQLAQLKAGWPANYQRLRQYALMRKVHDNNL
jgi:predicted kinase